MTNVKLLELLNSGKIEEAKIGLAENIRAEIEKGKGTKKVMLELLKKFVIQKRGGNFSSLLNMNM